MKAAIIQANNELRELTRINEAAEEPFKNQDSQGSHASKPLSTDGEETDIQPADFKSLYGEGGEIQTATYCAESGEFGLVIEENHVTKSMEDAATLVVDS